VVAVDLRRRMGTTGRRPSQGSRAFNAINAVILTGVVVATLYPFINILARSVSEEHAIRAGQVNLLPKGFNLGTYKTVMADGTFWTNYGRTVEYTVIGTIISLVLTTCYAYVTSKKQLRGRALLIGIAVFTLFFNGGIIPNYVLVSHLGMRDTLWAIVLPNAISVFNLLVMKAFFETLPVELEEAAEVDGMNTYGILLRIVLPLSKAIIATMVLFYAVAYWNSWFSAFLYMDKQGLFPVTMYLRNLIAGATGGTNEDAATDQALQVAANIKAVTVVLTVLPILVVYPFIQRYFVTGILLGAVKE
jgi:putative aldouronate transport system permease protein